MGKIQRSVKRFKKWKKNVYDHKDKVDIGRNIKLPYRTKLKYNLLGFTDQDYYDYDLEHNDYHKYISHNERLNLENANGRFAYPLGEKLTFERNFGSFVNVPHIFWWNRNQEFVDPNSGGTLIL